MRSTPTPRSTSTGISLRPICVTVGGLCGSQLHTAHSGLSSLRVLSLFFLFRYCCSSSVTNNPNGYCETGVKLYLNLDNKQFTPPFCRWGN